MKHWKYYHPESFLKAVNKMQLAEAKLIKNDERFFQFENPQVFKQFVGDGYRKTFKEVYGFDYVKRVPDTEGKRSLLPCSKNCLKQEKSKFAKECRAMNGLFKCCVNRLDLSVYEKFRQELLEPEKTESLCGSSGGNGPRNKCLFCVATYSCTHQDGYAGYTVTEYMTKEVNEIGGLYIPPGNPTGEKRVGFRDSICLKQDYCNLDEENYSDLGFQFAANRNQFCNLMSISKNKKGPDKSEEIAECEKLESQVKICSEAELKKINDYELNAINDELLRGSPLRKIKKQSKGKKKRKRKRKKRSSKKRKKKKQRNTSREKKFKRKKKVRKDKRKSSE